MHGEYQHTTANMVVALTMNVIGVVTNGSYFKGEITRFLVDVRSCLFASAFMRASRSIRRPSSLRV